MRRIVVLAFVVALASIGAEREARACGGCFGPPDVPTVVTDHRMIMSISKDQSTLYDQIRYSGEPSAFAWVLPIAGTVKIGLSSDVLFSSFGSLTEVQVSAPALVCRQADGQLCGRANRVPVGDSAEESPAGGVDVIAKEVVGPYETVQLATSDPNALDQWLTDNGFTLPADVKPVIAQYVSEKFNFLAMRLLPGKGVQDMRPVRITTAGAGSVLPLRMVAAGTGATVGITLWTVAEGRYEPQGFPSFVISNAELTYDPVALKSNYADLRVAKTQAGGGRAWEIESSVAIRPADWIDEINALTTEPTAWEPEKDANGTVIKSAAQVAKEDVGALFHGLPTQAARLTRMRADLAHAALDRDLPLSASADQSELQPLRRAARWTAQPSGPLGCPAGCYAENAPGYPPTAAPSSTSSAGEPASLEGSGSSCATGASDKAGWSAFALGAIAFAAIRRRRR
jgi:hypothetical protein